MQPGPWRRGVCDAGGLPGHGPCGMGPRLGVRAHPGARLLVSDWRPVIVCDERRVVLAEQQERDRLRICATGTVGAATADLTEVRYRFRCPRPASTRWPRSWSVSARSAARLPGGSGARSVATPWPAHPYRMS